MTNADKFKSLFGLYATELWAMPEKDFLKWLNSEAMNCSEFPNNSDTISRKAAIGEVKKHYRAYDNDLLELITFDIERLPPAQPEERTKKRTETHASDCVSRQAAIDALKRKTFRLTFAEEQNCEGHVAWSADVVYSEVMEGELLELPSVQPEEAIPVAWIEARIERFMTMDNAFGGLTANIMLVMLNEWKREQEGETE